MLIQSYSIKSALHPSGTVCVEVFVVVALQMHCRPKFSEDGTNNIILLLFFQEERFQMVFDLAQELIDEDYHRADVISAR